MTGRTPDVTQVWNFERTVGNAVVSLPSYFRGQGYVTLYSGKVWHWGPGPDDSWSDDLAAMWPTSSVSNLPFP
jgi:arylsulfatase A-like enzyme